MYEYMNKNEKVCRCFGSLHVCVNFVKVTLLQKMMGLYHIIHFTGINSLPNTYLTS